MSARQGFRRSEHVLAGQRTSRPGITSTSFACPRPGARISNASPATWKPAAAPAPPSPAGFAPSPVLSVRLRGRTAGSLPGHPRPQARLDYESHAIGLDRNELGALLAAAGLGPLAEHALISLPTRNGLRVSEATGANIQDLGAERGHRTLVITRKGGKVATIPLAPRTARAIDLTIASAAKDLSSSHPAADGWTGTVR
jgi:integrase